MSLLNSSLMSQVYDDYRSIERSMYWGHGVSPKEYGQLLQKRRKSKHIKAKKRGKRK